MSEVCPPHGQWSTADCHLRLLGQALQGAYSDLQDDSALPLMSPSFFSIRLHSSILYLQALPRLLRVSCSFTSLLCSQQ